MADEGECSDTCTRNICEWCPEADRQAALVETFRRQLGLDAPAPAPHAEEEGEYTGPCRFCRHPAGKHDVDAECWIEGCACGTGESGDPASAPRAEEGQR